MIRGLLVILFLFSVATAHASTTLPRQLSESDRRTATQVLGLGSMMKLLSDPYPLGGYEGLELGFSSEYIPFESVADLGTKSTDRGEYNYYTLSLGKGLFYNVDVFLQFTPLPQNEGMSNYGAQLRWGFYEARFFPFSLSLVLTGGGSSFSSLINSSTLGSDLVGSVNMRDVALYFGIGRAHTGTTFVGGASGVTDDGDTHTVSLSEGHELFGVHFKFKPFFLALQVDRYSETTYSGKIGTRF